MNGKARGKNDRRKGNSGASNPGAKRPSHRLLLTGAVLRDV